MLMPGRKRFHPTKKNKWIVNILIFSKNCAQTRLAVVSSKAVLCKLEERRTVECDCRLLYFWQQYYMWLIQRNKVILINVFPTDCYMISCWNMHFSEFFCKSDQTIPKIENIFFFCLIEFFLFHQLLIWKAIAQQKAE